MLIEKPEHIDKVAAGCIMYCDDKVLLFKRTDTGVWNSIVGNMKGEENPRVAIRREIMEELNISVETEEIAVLYHKYGKELVEYHLNFARINKSQAKSIKLNYEHSDYGLFSIDEALKLELFEDKDYCQKLVNNKLINNEL